MKKTTIPEFENYSIDESGNVTNLKTGRVLIQTFRGEYLSVQLSKSNCKLKRFSVHRLLATYFIPNLENKPHINHINGIKTDNRLENLEWCTRKENAQHAVKNGLWISTDKHKKSSSDRMLKYNEIMHQKRVLNTDTGIYYDCIKDAAKSINMKPANLGNRLKGKYKNKTPFIYV